MGRNACPIRSFDEHGRQRHQIDVRAPDEVGKRCDESDVRLLCKGGMHRVNVLPGRRMKNETDGVKPVQGNGGHGECAVSTVIWGRG